MSKEVQACMDKVRQELDALKMKSRESILDEFGLYSTSREYATQEYTNGFSARAAGFDHMELKDGKYVYYREDTKTYFDVTDEEFGQLLALKAERDALMPPPPVEVPVKVEKPDEYAVKPDSPTGASQSARFMRNIAWMVWILGALTALLGSGLFYGRFNFTAFISTMSTYFITGMAFKCMAELFENLQTIASSLSGMTITKKH